VKIIEITKMKLIPYSRQYINDKDIINITKILKSDYLTKGSQTIKFENEVKKRIKSKYALAVINASSALILACRALELQKNQYLWTTAITYVASVNCALHCQAKIDLIDIDYGDNNISIDHLKKKLIIAKKKKILPKILVIVHLSGLPCRLREIKKLSKKYNFKIIEDASHAFGSTYFGSPIGSCKYSDISIFSFHPVKVITTAEGGIISTNNKNIYNKIYTMRENGLVIKEKINYNFLYDIKSLGYNFRINEINSSLGISQLRQASLFIRKKFFLAKRYFKYLSQKEITLPLLRKNYSSSWHLFIIKINFNLLKIDKNQFIKKLRDKKIFANFHYIPLYKFSFISRFLKIKILNNSEKYFREAVSLPLFPQMSKTEQDYVIKNVISIIKNNRIVKK
jgi:dTDP-4-amino-4,6-dideoxygalactose transaminase